MKYLIICFAVLAVAILIINESNITFAQSATNFTLPLNRTQEWISQRDDVKILFTYRPERPIIDTFTKLEFRAVNLTNNENLKDFDARVVVTNGQRLFKFENITVPDGDFSVEYIFPDDGTHQVVLRIDKGAFFSVVASFNVLVPHQAPPSILNPFYIPPGSEIGDNPAVLLSIVLAIVLPVSGVVGLIIIFKLGKTKSKKW